MAAGRGDIAAGRPARDACGPSKGLKSGPTMMIHEQADNKETLQPISACNRPATIAALPQSEFAANSRRRLQPIDLPTKLTAADSARPV